MINTLKDYLVTQLKTTSLGDNVYDFVVTDPEDVNNVVYPHAYVVFDGSSSEFATNQSVERFYNFKIRARYEVGSDLNTLSAVDTIMYDLVDEIHALLDGKRCADGNALIMSISSTSVSWENSETPVRVIEILVSFMVNTNI